MKAQEIEGEFNEQEEDEDEGVTQQGVMQPTFIDCDLIKSYGDFKLALIQLEEERILKLCDQSEEAIMKQAAVLDEIETIKKEKQKEQIQHISKIFSMIPQYTQKLFQIQQLQAQTKVLMERIKKKSRID